MCRAQFGRLDQLKTELDVQYPELAIEIIGVNEAGEESGNAQICEGRDIPWLQDTASADWWGTFDPTYRDVIILDGEGKHAAAFNLTARPLTEDPNFVELKALLVEMGEAAKQ